MTSRLVLKGSLFIAVLVALLGGLAVWRLLIIVPVPVTEHSGSLFDFTVSDLDGRPVALSAYRGQVALVVNVASECGLAVQYPGLDELYRSYKDRGFVVLAFPSDDFWQEPNTNAGIRTVCEGHGVTFPVFAKGHVRGVDRAPVYGFLAATGETPIWNFAKYLVGRDGHPRAFFGSLIQPDSSALTSAIERALAESPTVDGLK